MRNLTLLKCGRSRSEIWKKEDITNNFDIVSDASKFKTEDEAVKEPSKAIEKFDRFVCKPFRFGGFENFDNALYYELFGIVANEDSPFVTYKFICVVEPKKKFKRMY